MRRAIVVGAGPNGLAAAVELARAGVEVTVVEANASVGGGTSTAELTLPGFRHDVCSAVHPMAAVSPFFRDEALESEGLRWITPPAALAHPLGGAEAAVLENSLEETARGLGRDGDAWRRALGPLQARWDDLIAEVLAPPHLPRSPLLLARFGALALAPASWCARLFRDPPAKALLAGLAGHGVLPFECPGSSAIAWVLALAAGAAGWPIPEGGSQAIADALASRLRRLGGRIETGRRVATLDELGSADAILCDVTPAQLLRLAGDRLPARYARALRRWRYGPGAFKLDWALDGPIPWSAPDCARAATVHVGGTFAELAEAERAPWDGRPAERPFVLVAQPSLFDPTRAPAGKHTAWAYCHVPHGSREDMTARVEAQIERFAPGFRGRILARHALNAAGLELHDANLVGGDITGGAQDLRQLLVRPTARLYRTPVRGLYLCSASTPPGGGVHGLCGRHAARAALDDLGHAPVEKR